MEKTAATSAFFALSQPTRLDIFRLLIKAGHPGMLAGELSARLGVLQNTMSTNLTILLNADLVRKERQGRNIRYTANTGGIRDLVEFLMEDCCQGRPEICAPMIAQRSALLDTALIPKERYDVLFVCTGNSARSLMAEAIMNSAVKGRFRAYSAGSMPAKSGPHPYTIDLLRNLNHDLSAVRTKSWTEFSAVGAPEMDFVFTVCDRSAVEVCPVWSGQPMSAHWGVPDPAANKGNEAERKLAFSESYRMLRNRISLFMDLPIGTLDKLSLQRQLDDVGQNRDLAADA